MPKNRISEKVEQAHVIQLLRSVGGKVYVLGTRRPTGDYQGTCQTPGISDLLAVLPTQTAGVKQLLFVEVKAQGGRLRPEQQEFKALIEAADTAHVHGGLDAVIAWLIDAALLKRENVPHYRVASIEGRP